MNPPPIILEAKKLRKHFGSFVAVDNVSFQIREGIVAGFVGRNGAGKTTALRMLMGLEIPSSGEAFICGENVMENANRMRSCVGWMPDTCGAYDNTTVWEYLDFFARAYGFVGSRRKYRVDIVTQQTNLGHLLNRETTILSRGESQRLSFARALLHEPKVLLLDEPAAGLDPEARLNFKTLVRSLVKQGTTFLISSHILSELAEICDEILFLDGGKILRHAAIQDLLREKTTSVRVRAQDGAFQAGLPLPIRCDLLSTSSVRLYLSDAKEETLASTLRSLVLAGIQITEFVPEERKLEEIFLETVQQIQPLCHEGD